ncbi:YqzL family protein [Sporomusa sp.]|uniref:YqzL family protein n=1 Tax=Sporomusa sp. TaxID=2078658 RepID=UPI0039C8C4EE
MWEIFLSTGNIDAYLTYRACLDSRTSQLESADESTELLAEPEYLWNNLLREVRWQ